MAKSRKELEAKLTPQQQLAAMMLVEAHLSDEMDMRGKDFGAISDELKIHRQTLWRWRRDPDFIAYMNILTRSVLGSFESEVMGLFIDKIRQEPTSRNVELFAKITGLLKNEKEVHHTSSETRTKEDIEREIAEANALLDDFGDMSDLLDEK